MRLVKVADARVELPNDERIILLNDESDRQRFLPIFVSPADGKSIALALQGTKSPRPELHELFRLVLDQLEARVAEVVITELREGTYYAELVIRTGTSTTDGFRVSARPSDAIALAVRYEPPVPIYVHQTVIDQAGLTLAGDDRDQVEQLLARWIARQDV